MALALGKNLIYLYNDAFIPLGGLARHPSAFGQPVHLVWQEIWPVILLPRLTHTLATGEPSAEEDLFIPLTRSGYREETYISFSFAALPDDQDRPSGIFCTATENTARVIARRQIDCLRRLAAHGASADSSQNVCRAAVATLEEQQRDVPFGLIYLLEPASAIATLTGTCGLKQLPPNALASAHLGSEPEPFHLAGVASRREALLIENVEELVGSSLCRADLVPRQALAIPLANPASQGLAGILVAGVNPMRPLAESREFLALVAAQLEVAISNAHARHDAEERARKLAEIDRAKTVFLGNISHELRTPLTLLLGPLEDLLAGCAIDTKERHLLMTARRAASRLLKLVNSLLEFSRLEAGRWEARYMPVDLAALTAGLASEFRSAFEQAGVALWVECPPLAQPVYVDSGMWERILLNLLSNALKFTLSGAVTVRLSEREDAACLEVADTGCGITDEDMPHLFERFHRGHARQARSVEGAGIGLSLVHELVTLHGGTVRAASIPGSGTTITVSVPLGAGHLPPGRIEAARQLLSLQAKPFIDEALGWIAHAGGMPVSEHPAEHSLETETNPSQELERILIVDDNSDMRGYLCRLLGQRYRVRTARNGQEALAGIRTGHYDLLIVDIMMPLMNGLDLLRSVRADPAISRTPIILLAAQAGGGAAAEGLRAGADDYVAKPFSRQELLARVENRLTQARLHAAEQLARRRAEAAIRAHGDLYSILAHDLRSPLQTAYLCLTRIQQQEMTPAIRKTTAALERGLASLHQQLDAILGQIESISGERPDDVKPTR